MKIGFCRGLRVGIDEQSFGADVSREASTLLPDALSVEPLEIHRGVDAVTNLSSSFHTDAKIQYPFLRASNISIQDDLLKSTIEGDSIGANVPIILSLRPTSRELDPRSGFFNHWPNSIQIQNRVRPRTKS